MSDEIFDTEKLIPVLNEIMKAELAGVVRYTHYALVITGPNRLPLVDFMKTQASESLLHAQMVGELVTGLGGHPDQGIAQIEESHDHSLETVLRESIAHERRALRDEGDDRLHTEDELGRRDILPQLAVDLGRQDEAGAVAQLGGRDERRARRRVRVEALGEGELPAVARARAVLCRLEAAHGDVMADGEALHAAHRIVEGDVLAACGSDDEAQLALVIWACRIRCAVGSLENRHLDG